ncbi:MAG TPA: aminotransferase class I/II-fold pyridoxal phosphate-dependent enzyme [Candidatus Krumholzibacteria bacterium]|nr:aminotransferase class I/II-fold pyridoxal phosphate-dependent enzyme [Candidatus Krumholzibacteria bacterium]
MTLTSTRRSDYLEWVKRRRDIRHSLSRSGAPRFDMRELATSLDQILTSEPNEDGWPPLLEVIAARAGLTPAHVTLANACTGANHLAFRTLLDPGDHVVMETPVYEPLAALARYCGARLDFFPRHASNGWRVDPGDVARALTPKTKLVVLSNLHNPTGCHDNDETIGRIAEHAQHNGAHVLVDEVYIEFLHAAGVRTAARLAPNILITNSMTKTYGLDQLRMGWVLAEPRLLDRMRRLSHLYINNMAHPSERLAWLALSRADEILARANAVLDRNLAIADAFVASQPRLSWVKPRAGTCGMVHVDGLDVDELSERLAREQATGIVPGRFFDAPSHFRLAWGVDTETVRAGLDALGLTLSRM